MVRVNCYISVADPEFARGGGANPPGGRQHMILPKFPKKYMKLKEFGPKGGFVSKISLCRSATGSLKPWSLADLQGGGGALGKKFHAVIGENLAK